MTVRAYLLRRLREPSTWAGLALVLGVSLPAEAAQLGATLAGLVAVLLPEGAGNA